IGIVHQLTMMILDELARMNLNELRQRLHEEGCNPRSYAIGVRGGASDAFCLTHDGTAWQVYYTERGCDQPPFYTSTDEAEACAFFFNYMMGLRHTHCVGFFRSEAAAQALHTRLEQLGLEVLRDVIPYGGTHDPRYRVFVLGTAIFAARAELGAVPVRD
ncbi:MAG: SPOR domain-containing protein, partial [Chloroflexaceae bacterium]|nr:SPOR domain-containing protein [Chloroflexaceae bacterium]